MTFRLRPDSARALALFVTSLSLLLSCRAADPAPALVRFEVAIAPGLVDAPQTGRLFVVVSPVARPEPIHFIGETGNDNPPVLARDVAGLTPGGKPAVLGAEAAIFPLARLTDLPPGNYYMQALLATNRDLKSRLSPGNLYSKPQVVRISAARNQAVRIALTEQVPEETLPPETEYVKYVKLLSERLSAFHKRSIYLRAGILLPLDYDREPTRRYPLRVQIGGFATRYTAVRGYQRNWLDPDAPRMILVHLDGDGPYGDPYQVNSANNGPYGDAVVHELIPHIERRFRAIGTPSARVLSGGSTGGWVSLALQIFYPDYFNGTWSYYPDSVDFRAFQLLNIYADTNAYVNRQGFERPSARELNGDVRFTMRHECRMENVMGQNGLWTLSGGQWGAWNAVYGPRGKDGRPVPLWDPQTGAMNREPGVLDQWRKYDLRLVLQTNWKTLGPKLRGKIHIAVGEADNYFLNNAVHLLDDFLRTVSDPPFEGQIIYGPGKGHGWQPISERQIMQEMAAAVEKKRTDVP